jgi:hypothetical protein
MTVDHAAQALALLPKPVTCTASVRADGILSLECKPFSSIEESAIHNSAIRGYRSVGSDRDLDLGSDTAGLSDQSRFLLVSGTGERSGERLKISLAAFRRWYHDYLQPFSVALGFDRPSRAEQVGGEEVEDIIRIHHVDPPDPEGVPPELRFLRR